ncbi:SatD family protein [Halanaerobium congolense]|uniref:SatD family protein n=1 Tax=Halanaerobium congolense TaxID=54121 RepID=A0A4R8GLT2_9FIRM|nr:SatD family protein [Halanaerobium congolense]TDX45498.1 SatD family protein [Halanaerobium congolense]
MNKYITIKGDIIKSKTIDNFAEVFAEKINQITHPEAVISKFEIVKGDEIRGIFAQDLNIIDFLRELRAVLLPLKIRLAITITEVDPGDYPDNKEKLFKKADGILDFIGQNRQFKTYISTDNELINKSLNTPLLLIDKIKFSWEQNDCLLYNTYTKNKDLAVLAEKFDYKKEELEKTADDLAFDELYISEHNLMQILSIFINN